MSKTSGINTWVTLYHEKPHNPNSKIRLIAFGQAKPFQPYMKLDGSLKFRFITDGENIFLSESDANKKYPIQLIAHDMAETKKQLWKKFWELM